jgi:hypothetical protein
MRLPRTFQVFAMTPFSVIVRSRAVARRSRSKLNEIPCLRFGTGSTISWWGLRLYLAGSFILGAEASGADVDFSFLSFYHNRSSLNIR